VRIEVDLVQEEGGVFRATAVAYPSVAVTGRTEKEALGLLVQAMEKHMKEEARKAASGS
jgi:predicted RNase H-like HicB family nuclease